MVRKLFAIASVSGVLMASLASEKINPQWLQAVSGQPDLTLPAWGPYSKRYIGISHIPNEKSGLRFDVSVFPTWYRRNATLPNVMFENNYHPWETTPDFSYFCFRHELEWKDQVYADVSYSRLDDQSRLIRAEFVNHTDEPQNLALHLLACMNFPALRENHPNTPILPASVALPPNALWVNAIDYQDLHFAKSRPKDNLVDDGYRRGEIRANGFVHGSGLGDGFGTDADDQVTYSFRLNPTLSHPCLVLRYRMKKGDTLSLRFSGVIHQTETFVGTGKLETKTLSPIATAPGTNSLTIISHGGNEIELDGFAIAAAADLRKIVFAQKNWNPIPQIISGPQTNSLILKYADTDKYYGITWQFHPFEVRQFLSKNLDVYFQTMVQNHVDSILKDDGEGHFTDIFLRPVFMAPHSERTVYGEICSGTRAEVEQMLSHANLAEKDCDQIYQSARAKLPDLAPAPQGTNYLFSQQRMAATLLENVVYPIYTQGSYIKHNTPGRVWDSLYTWDSGFVGLGLAELDAQRSLECLNTYLTAPGAQSAFLHHGSMVPVQHYLFLDLWNRTQSQELLSYCYPRLKQYYEFYIGRLGSSTMRKFHSGVLSSFDYFYNSGGWDDYPPQKFVRYHDLASVTAPVCNTAQAIRIAKIMRMAAEALGKTEDAERYTHDVASLADSLQKNSWDEATGYFSYVEHDSAGNFKGFLRYKNGANYNLGMDGVYPLVAGIGTPAQTARMLAHLKSPTNLWSRIGLSAVDQSAPYYQNDGYWNGTVWMPHQWFFWKSMLDLGESDFAWQIARTGLEVWKNEVNTSYHCMEHFMIETGRGAGWHEFGGLSSPVLKWYDAYCRPGNLTTGFNVWTVDQAFSADNSHLVANLKLYRDETSRDHCTFVACLNPAFEYEILWQGQPLSPKVIAQGLFNIEVPLAEGSGKLEIKRR